MKKNPQCSIAIVLLIILNTTGWTQSEKLQNSIIYEVPTLQVKMVIDGSLDESAWSAAPTGEFSGHFTYSEVSGPNDFHQLVIQLKSWGIPFDVVRLDQQFLDRHMFLDFHGNPKYGTIIWDVNQSEKLLHPDYSIIQEMVVDFGMGLIALSDRILQAEIQSVLGLNYVGS